jgi:hypothetical protein
MKAYLRRKDLIIFLHSMALTFLFRDRDLDEPLNPSSTYDSRDDDTDRGTVVRRKWLVVHLHITL